jgi:pimeloyl-ACP methyl ester carboxylesterase
MVPTSYGQAFVRISGPAGAPPLVLLPGGTATSLMWAPNIRALSGAYRTFAVDQIGDVGRSTCIKPVRRVKDLLVWLDELFDALKLEDGINLAGVSYGGWLTAEYALHAPKRLNKIVLLTPGSTVLRFSTKFFLQLFFAAISFAAIGRRWCVLPLFRWLFADWARTDPGRFEEEVDWLVTIMRSLQPRRLPFPTVMTDAEWGGLRVPAVFLVGEHEHIYAADRAVRRLRRVAPHVRTEIVPGAGHDLTVVRAEMVSRKILDFLTEEPAPADARRSLVPEADRNRQREQALP